LLLSSRRAFSLAMPRSISPSVFQLSKAIERGR
jgi:hypothetical protein